MQDLAEPQSNSRPGCTLGLRTRELPSAQRCILILILTSHPPFSPEIARPTEPRPGGSKTFLLSHATGMNKSRQAFAAFSCRPPTGAGAVGGSCDPARRDATSSADSPSRCSACSRVHHRNKQTARQAPPPRPPVVAKSQPLRLHLRLLTSSFPETLLPLSFGLPLSANCFSPLPVSTGPSTLKISETELTPLMPRVALIPRPLLCLVTSSNLPRRPPVSLPRSLTPSLPL